MLGEELKMTFCINDAEGICPVLSFCLDCDMASFKEWEFTRGFVLMLIRFEYGKGSFREIAEADE